MDVNVFSLVKGVTMSIQQAKSGDRIMIGEKITIEASDLQVLITVLAKKGYRTIGPTIREGAIVYDDISGAKDLPQGWSDEQGRASYRLKERTDKAFFGFTLAVQSWKRFLHPPTKHLWGATKDPKGFKLEDKTGELQKMAFIGVRPCELFAIEILDKALMDGPYRDFNYVSLRKNTFVVAVNCSQSGGTCFCASMNTGPVATKGFDLALTELIEDDSHKFLVEVGTEAGAEIISKLPSHIAGENDIKAAEEIANQISRHMGRTLDTNGVKELLYRNYENPQWESAAKRCLSCGNCTMVCPTCFCTTVEDSTDLLGTRADRALKWDSCFTIDFSYIHGGSIRTSTKSRYRQMVTHKIGAWYDQFGCTGCVGCGRCITWCPAAIDITEEVGAIRESERTAMATAKTKEGSNANN
jgi:sulfhydrogenase subunit beta (sulfur reductase)